ncbi:MAG: glutamate--tRNA ligase [Sphingomonadales bacterium]
MPIKVRFAPSPTGLLHVGNARIALVNWLFARKSGGRFLLRMDDTDSERSTDEFATAIKQDLVWLGLEWDEFARQSDRYDRYGAAIEKLKSEGRLYACYETPAELDRKRKFQLAQRKPPIYDRMGLHLSDEDRARFEAEGRKPHWRFLLDREAVEWTDAVRGPVSFDAASLSDPVLVRGDGRPLYTLSSVVDDIELGISHVMRGEDHVANTAAQIQLFSALGAEVPVFAHLALLVGSGGEGLSKRYGSLSLKSLREQNIEPMAINSLLARLGTADPVEAFKNLDHINGSFDLSRFGRAAAHFDPTELRALNARILHAMPFGAAREHLAAIGLGDADEAFWDVVRPNLETIEDAAMWWGVVYGPVTPRIEDGGLLAKAVDLLPMEPWDGETWRTWTTAVKETTGAKGKGLFLPLRLALTGLDHGPEMKNLLPLIGSQRARVRLRGETG